MIIVEMVMILQLRIIFRKIFSEEKEAKPIGFWNNYENCKIETEKYNILDDFRIGSAGCYDALIRNGWLNELTSHMKRKKNQTHIGLENYAQK